MKGNDQRLRIAFLPSEVVATRSLSWLLSKVLASCEKGEKSVGTIFFSVRFEDCPSGAVIVYPRWSVSCTRPRFALVFFFFEAYYRPNLNMLWPGH